MSATDFLFITCPPRVVVPLVEDLTRRLEAEEPAARILKYGVLCKNRDGFIILAMPQASFSSNFFAHIKQDEEITGYVTLTSNDTELNAQEAYYDNNQ